MSQRCGQPAQQHGLLIPPRSFDSPTVIRRVRVSACFAEETQQIHSLRARGVISSQVAKALESATRAFLKSAGILCTGAVEVFLMGMGLLYSSAPVTKAQNPASAGFCAFVTEPYGFIQ